MIAPVLARLDTHEKLLAGQAADLEAQIAELTARLGEITGTREHLRITRKTLLDLDTDVPVPPHTPRPLDLLPGNPAYGQILDTLAAATGPLRAREVCQALDLPPEPTTINGMRHKLKRMVERGVLTEPEPGLFDLPHTTPPREPDTSRPNAR